jgi:hypothetical protein
MNEQEMCEYLKGKPQEEIRELIREFTLDRLKKMCEEGEKLSVNNEDYEKANLFLKFKNRLK